MTLLSRGTLMRGAMPTSLGPAGPRQHAAKQTVLTACQAGHGLTTGGTGITWNLNDTTDQFAGTQCVSAVTSGAGGQSWVQRNGFPAIDLTTCDITIWVKVVNNIDQLKRIQVVLTPDGFSTYFQGNGVYEGSWPGVPNRQMREGEWFPLRFNFDALKDVTTAASKTAITGMRITLEDKAAGTPTTVRIGMITYQQRPASLANGVISLTFDDSYASTYSRAVPALAQRGYAGTAYIIKELTGSSPSWMTTANYLEMQTAYGWEIAPHAYTLANHNAGFDVLSPAALDIELRSLKAWMIDNGFNGIDHLAYPLGHHSPGADPVVARYFATARALYDQPTETVQPAVPLRMRSLGMQTGTLAAVQARVDRVAAHGSWLNLVFHDVPATGGTGNQFNITDLNTLLDYIATKGVQVLPVGDVWRAGA